MQAAQRHQQALAQVARVYTQLLARGEPVTSCKTLAKAAHVRIDTVLEFLRADAPKGAGRMQSPKLGNPRRKPKARRKRQHRTLVAVQPLKRARLMLHEADPITGNEDTLYSLSYECYRGYTIYSTPGGAVRVPA